MVLAAAWTLGSAAALALAPAQAFGQTSAARRDIQACWSPPAGAPSVRVGFSLSPDGALLGEPVVLDPSQDPRAKAAEAAAIRAVRRCSPYKLPPANDAKGLRVIVTFDPADAR